MLPILARLPHGGAVTISFCVQNRPFYVNHHVYATLAGNNKFNTSKIMFLYISFLLPRYSFNFDPMQFLGHVIPGRLPKFSDYFDQLPAPSYHKQNIHEHRTRATVANSNYYVSL